MSIETFQKRATVWVQNCFGNAIADSIEERNYRFLEEALELVQSTGLTKEQAITLVDYVFSRPVGETNQEVGGVMITLAALCRVQGTNMWDCGETDLALASIKTDKIRIKWGTKPQNIRGRGLVVELADTDGLSPSDFGHGGSSPSGPTKFTPYQSYIAQLPSSELPIAVGDKRLCAVDGFGPMEAEVTQVNDDEVTIKVADEPYLGSEFELRWDLLGPNTYVGWLIDGEEHKKYLAQAEEEAMNGACVQ